MENHKKSPNILIINPDEMRWDTMGHMGNPAAQTPNLDAFASTEAVSFSHAYCQNPVCVPSRCSFFTGLYPHVHGHRTMSYLLHPGDDTLFSELKRAGYYVWMNDRNDLFAGQEPGWMEENADEIHYASKGNSPGPIKELRGTRGSKDYYSHYEGCLGLDSEGRNVNRDDETVEAATRRILNPVDERPLCMFLGLMWPHVPYGCEEPYFSAVDRSKLPPRIHASQCSGKPQMETLLREYIGMNDYTEEDWNQLRGVYLGMCQKIDAQFGKIMQALKDAGIYDNTLVLFMSDHGDYAGDFDLVEKAQNCFEDCLTRVPFLVKPPKEDGVDPGISPALVELVDLYATVMDYAGVTPSHTHYGRSLRPVLEERSRSHRDAVFCEGGRMPGETHCDEYHIDGPLGTPESFLYWPKKKAQSNDLAHGRGIMMRERRYKYISRLTESDELYDLIEDPGETTNRINDPGLKKVAARMQTEMLKWLQATSDVVPYRYDSRFNPRMMWEMVRHHVPEKKEAQVRQMIAEGATLPAIMRVCDE